MFELLLPFESQRHTAKRFQHFLTVSHSKSSYLLAGLNIPHGDVAVMRSNGELMPTLAPRHRGHGVSIGAQITQSCHLNQWRFLSVSVGLLIVKVNSHAAPEDKKVFRGYQTYLTCTGTPQIYATAESHGQHVLRRPIHQVEVEVVLKLGCIENLEGNP
jgi:hypothetical protein